MIRKHNFKIGELVEIDKNHTGATFLDPTPKEKPWLVTILDLRKEGLFCTVKNDKGYKWDTSISRLSKI